MRLFFKIIRAVLLTLIIVFICVPTATYLLFSSDWAQEKLRVTSERELSQLLGTDVKIGYVKLQPFSRLKIEDVSVEDDFGNVSLTVGVIESRAEIVDLLLRQKFILDYAVIKSLELKLYRETTSSPLNIEGIISRLKSDEKKEPKMFDFHLNSISLVDCAVSYDVLSEPETSGRFNKNHISLSNIDCEAFAPCISNDCYKLRMRSFRCSEKSGLGVKKITADILIDENLLSLRDLNVELPGSLLSFNDVTAELDGISSLSSLGTSIPVEISLADGSHLALADLAPLVPAFADSGIDLSLGFDIEGTTDTLCIKQLNVEDRINRIACSAFGTVFSLARRDSMAVSRLTFRLAGIPSAAIASLGHVGETLDYRLGEILAQAGNTEITGVVSGNFSEGELSANMLSSLGKASLAADYRRIGDEMKYIVETDLSIDSIHPSAFHPSVPVTCLVGSFNAKGIVSRTGFDGGLNAVIDRLDCGGYTYRNLSAVVDIKDNDIDATIDSRDRNLMLSGRFSRTEKTGLNYFDGKFDIRSIRLDSLRLNNRFPGYILSSAVTFNACATSIDNFKAALDISDIKYCDAAGDGLKMKSLSVDADNMGRSGYIWLSSDIINGSVEGVIRPSTLPAALRRIAGSVIPALRPNPLMAGLSSQEKISDNDFTFDFEIEDTETLSRFFGLPVAVIDQATINGEISEQRNLAFLHIDMPWLLAGENKIAENTSAALRLGGEADDIMGHITTYFPTIKGPMTLVTSIGGANGTFKTDIDWSIERAEPINGKLALVTTLTRNADNRMEVDAHFNPGKINFGEDVWTIHDSSVRYADHDISVDGFMLTSGEQKLTIDGTAGLLHSDTLRVTMDNIHLLNIFETLGIDNALLSGNAFGDITATALLASDRSIVCDNTRIKGVGYNRCILGEAEGRMWFDNSDQAFCFGVDILSDEGYKSNIIGRIVPATHGIDLKFDADHVKLGFMQPFMSAFCSGVNGTGSGYANLYGTFEDIDMVGDLYADTLSLKIDFTNVWYHASDSIHIRPGRINLDDLRIYDSEGHSAIINGYIGHQCFRNAVFDINITGADDLLCYDVPKSMSPDWYGKIYGDGAASVVGRPGIVNITANMRTAQNSVFTFELSDFEIADEYSFITFRDVTPREEIEEDVVAADPTPERVKTVRESKKGSSSADVTDYVMDISIDVNQSCRIVLVMDPVGGDKIDSAGDGHIRMTYEASGNDLKLYGQYTLDHGDYNFTLQDIIIKNFTIKPGSSIRFNGNPYAGILDIEAYNTVNANLSDLDESFLTDKDLNRTNVPVRALMKVTGDMRQPDLSFDLEFPTLNSDIYRKVRSIVSTDEMMNKQIIYLLVLNRFFTPEYMSATRGNELFSVASSTISSQLSSMLGKLSDNWSIAPNLRSDKGDFSDVEVDVNLSSSLLNNRLLFNGNFGYRDKSLNTNQFVGDFDVEYLLNRSGAWRLKAYNRYNDQNYYLRTAQTTQGLGFVFRKDFDNIFGFLHKKKKDTSEAISPTDSVPETGAIK